MFQKHKYALKTSLTLVLFNLIFSISGNFLFAQSDPEIEAKVYFEEGDFASALPIFTDLINLYPSDETLNYYYGACLVETNNFTNETRLALENALDEEVKALYYLGKYYHSQSNWVFARSYYDDFIDSAKKKDIKSTDVEELIDLCAEEINPFIPAQAEAEEESYQTEELVSTEEENQKVIDEPVNTIAEEIIPEPKEILLEIPDELKDETINFPVNSSISYLKIDQFKTAEGQQAFITSWQKEQEMDKKLDEATKLREAYANTSYTEQEQLAIDIRKLEQETYQANREIREAYSKANTLEAAYWANASAGEINAFRQRITEIQDSIQSAEKAHIIEVETTKKEIALPIVSRDTTTVVIEDETPEPVTQEQTIDEITYKIQIGAYSKTPPDWVQNLFKKISVIRKIDNYTDDNGVTVYTIGKLKSYEDALQMQKQIKQEGVEDASIAAYKNNERISVSEARKLEKQ